MALAMNAAWEESIKIANVVAHRVAHNPSYREDIRQEVLLSFPKFWSKYGREYGSDHYDSLLFSFYRIEALDGQANADPLGIGFKYGQLRYHNWEYPSREQVDGLDRQKFEGETRSEGSARRKAISKYLHRELRHEAFGCFWCGEITPDKSLTHKSKKYCSRKCLQAACRVSPEKLLKLLEMLRSNSKVSVGDLWDTCGGAFQAELSVLKRLGYVIEREVKRRPYVTLYVLKAEGVMASRFFASL